MKSAPPPVHGVFADSPARDQFRCTVAANTALCREHYRLVLRLPSFPATEPGQFIQVLCRDVVDSLDVGRAEAVEREVEWTADGLPRLGGIEVATPGAFLRRP